MARNNFFVKTGSYTGNGADDRSITGLGFRPQFVIVKGSNVAAAFRIDKMAINSSGFLNATADVADAIQEFLSDGFQVGTHSSVNTNAVTYYWMAFAGFAGQSYFRAFTYVGSGVDNRNLTGLGLNFTPNVVAVKQTGAVAGVCRTSSMGADNSFQFSNSADATNQIQSLISNGVQLGSSTSANGNTTSYWGFAFKALSGIIAVGTYTGNGVDDRAITGVGFQPGFIIAKSAAATGSAVLKPSSLAGDSSLFAGTASASSNVIQSLDADGFTIGTDNGINQNGTAYWWIAFKEGSFQLPLSRTTTTRS